MCLPVFGYEGSDTINFPLLVSFLLRAQSLLGIGLHVTLRNQHFVRHRKLKKGSTEKTLQIAHFTQMSEILRALQ